MNPKPLASLNHLTVPAAISISFLLCSWVGIRLYAPCESLSGSIAHRWIRGTSVSWRIESRSKRKRGIFVHVIPRIALAAAVIFSLAACNTLPTIDPGAAAESAPARLEGTRGPLSAQQSKAVLARLESRSPQTSIFDRHLALEEAITGAPLTVGNKVVLLQNGPATYKE